MLNPPWPHTATVTRLRATSRRNTFGEPVEDWDHPERAPIDGVIMFPASTTENPTAGRDPADQKLTLLLPPGTDCTWRDRWDIDGHQWVTEGHPQTWHHPATGWTPGIQITVSRRQG